MQSNHSMPRVEKTTSPQCFNVISGLEVVTKTLEQQNEEEKSKKVKPNESNANDVRPIVYDVS